MAAAREAWPARSGARAPTRCQPSRWTVGRPASAAGAGRTQRSGFGVALTWGTLSSITPASWTRTDRGAPTDSGFSIRSATGRTACACEPQLHVSAHAHQTCTPFRGFSHPYPLTKVAPSSSLSPTTPGVRGRLHREVVAHRGTQALSRRRLPPEPSPTAAAATATRRAPEVQPAAPGNTGVAGRADERRVPASWSPGLPKRPARKRKGSARTGAICWRSLGWLRRPGADGAATPGGTCGVADPGRCGEAAAATHSLRRAAAATHSLRRAAAATHSLWRAAAVSRRAAHRAGRSQARPPAASSPIRWTWVLGLLAAGAAFRLARLGVGLVRLGRLARPADRVAPPAPAREFLARFRMSAAFVQPPDVRMPCSFGLFRPTVVLPAAFDRLEAAFQRGPRDGGRASATGLRAAGTTRRAERAAGRPVTQVWMLPGTAR